MTGDDAVLRDCVDAVTRASVLMDAGEADALTELFTEDLEFVRPSTYPEVAIRGREQFRQALAERDPRMVSRHVASNIVAIRTSETEIVVRSYFTHFRGYRDVGSQVPIPLADSLRSMGEYEDSFVQVGDRWLIARRVARFLFGGL